MSSLSLRFNLDTVIFSELIFVWKKYRMFQLYRKVSMETGEHYLDKIL